MCSGDAEVFCKEATTAEDRTTAALETRADMAFKSSQCLAASSATHKNLSNRQNCQNLEFNSCVNDIDYPETTISASGDLGGSGSIRGSGRESPLDDVPAAVGAVGDGGVVQLLEDVVHLQQQQRRKTSVNHLIIKIHSL